jgi:hypothetical protein
MGTTPTRGFACASSGKVGDHVIEKPVECSIARAAKPSGVRHLRRAGTVRADVLPTAGDSMAVAILAPAVCRGLC